MPSLQPSLMRSVEKITGKTKDTKTEAAELARKTMTHHGCTCPDCRRYEALVNNAKGPHEPTVGETLASSFKSLVTRGDSGARKPATGTIKHDEDGRGKPKKSKKSSSEKLLDSLGAVLKH